MANMHGTIDEVVSAAPDIGHNSGDKRERLQQLITDYVLAKRAAEQPEPLGDLGDLPSGERLVALRNFTLLGSVRYVRRTPGADVAVALLVWLSAMADNSQAMSRISFGRLARLFNRRPDRIGEAFARLKKAPVGRERGAPLPQQVFDTAVALFACRAVVGPSVATSASAGVCLPPAVATMTAGGPLITNATGNRTRRGSQWV
jgi:hypothetical protein